MSIVVAWQPCRQFHEVENDQELMDLLASIESATWERCNELATAEVFFNDVRKPAVEVLARLRLVYGE